MVDVYRVVERLISERTSAHRVPPAVRFYDIYKHIGGDKMTHDELRTELDALVEAGRLERWRGINGPIYYLTNTTDANDRCDRAHVGHC